MWVGGDGRRVDPARLFWRIGCDRHEPWRRRQDSRRCGAADLGGWRTADACRTHGPAAGTPSRGHLISRKEFLLFCAAGHFPSAECSAVAHLLLAVTLPPLDAVLCGRSAV